MDKRIVAVVDNNLYNEFKSIVYKKGLKIKNVLNEALKKYVEDNK